MHRVLIVSQSASGPQLLASEPRIGMKWPLSSFKNLHSVSSWRSFYKILVFIWNVDFYNTISTEFLCVTHSLGRVRPTLLSVLVAWPLPKPYIGFPAAIEEQRNTQCWLSSYQTSSSPLGGSRYGQRSIDSEKVGHTQSYILCLHCHKSLCTGTQ